MRCHVRNLIFLCLFLVLLTLIGCDSSGSSKKGTDDITLSGLVVNGPLADATVTVYDSDDFSIGSAVTNGGGYFSIDNLPRSTHYLVTATGGTLNGQPYTGMLTGRFTTIPCNLTPLTTVIEELSRKPGITYSEAEKEIKQWLGFDEDPFIADFEGNPMEDVDLAAVRESISQHGLNVWVSQMISLYEDNASPENREKGWFGDGSSTYPHVNVPPEASITSPSNNSSYIYGDIVSFRGVATDPEDGALPASVFVWRSSLDGLIETGSREFSTSFLSIGTHTITLTVTDSDGATDTATITVIIRRETLTNSAGMTFIEIPPGTFMMGSPPDEPGRNSDEIQYQVTLTQGFHMQTTPVTQGQWEAVMGSSPSYFFDCGDDCPVETVSWHDVQDFIAALNQLEETTGYALPTEAQWEYAARAGSMTAFANGPITETGSGNDPVLDSMGWYYLNSHADHSPRSDGRGTHPVAQKDPNTWGLYDMHGNVWEWVADWYGTYPTTAVADPIGPSSGANRVVRGGSWDYYARSCRSALRGSFSPGDGINYGGFRLVLLPGH